MRISAICLLILLCGCSTIGRRPDRQDLALTEEEEAFAQALAHYAQGLIAHAHFGKKSPEALDHFLAATVLDPDEHRTYDRAGFAYMSQGLYDDAVDVFRESAEQHPDLHRAQRNLAEACLVAGKTKEAIESYRTAVRLAPSETRYYLALANLLFNEEDDAGAMRVLKKAIRDDNKELLSASVLARGRQFIREGKSDRAIELFARLIKLNKSFTPAYLSLASLYFRKEDDRKALAVLRTALQRADQRPVLGFCYRQGRALIESGNVERSIPCFELMSEHATPRSPQLFLLLGDVYAQVGQKEEAMRYFARSIAEPDAIADSFVKLALMYVEDNEEMALEILREGNARIPDNATILFHLAQVYTMIENHQSAIDIFVRLEKMQNSTQDTTLTSGFYLQYGATFEQAGQSANAERVFEKCIATYPDAHPVLNYQAYMWAEQGTDLDKALEYVTRALALSPANGAYFDTLGWIYFKQNKNKAALEQILKAASLLKDDPVIMDHLGDTYNALNDEPRALEHWKHSFLLDTTNDSVADKLRARGVDLSELRNQASTSTDTDP